MLRRDGKVREIWGRQFRVVRDGLDEAEVFAFVSRIIDQNSELSSRLEHVDSLKRLAENAVIEATKQAERIKTETTEETNKEAKEIIIQAEEQTKAEAERIIAEAEESSLEKIAASEQLAQDMLQAAEQKAWAQAERIVTEAEQNARAQAEKIITEAEEKARAQAEKIIAEAEEKAKTQAEEQTKAEAEGIIAEAEKSSLDRIAAAEQLAQDMLQAAEEKARADAEKVVTEAEQEARAKVEKETKAEAERIIAEAEQKAKAEAESIVAQAQPRAEALAQEKLSLAEQKAKDIIRAAEEKAAEIKRLGEEEAPRIVAEDKGEVIEETVPLRREAEQPLPASGRIAESEIREIAKRVLEEFLLNPKDTEETTTRPTREESKAPPQPPRTQAAVHAPADTVGEELQGQPSLGQEEADEKESPALYRGTVEVAIPPPVAVSKMLKVHRWLTRAQQVSLLDVAGSAGRGVIIRLFLRSPTPLIDMLEDLPEVQAVAPATKQADKTDPSQHRAGEPAIKRLVVTIKR